METLVANYALLKTIWVVWFFILFVGMLWWVMRPAKRRHYEQFGDIPLRDDQPSRS